MNQAGVVFLLFLILPLFSFAAPNQSPPSAEVLENGLPIVFEPADPGTGREGGLAMVGRAGGMAVGFLPGAAVVKFAGKGAGQLRIDFDGASETVPRGTDPQKSQTNYLVGNDPARWRTHVPNFGKVTYAGLYSGIDAIFYGNGHQIEHDFVISPGADYRQIRMHLSGKSSISLRKDGALDIRLKDGVLRMQKPVVYQEEKGRRLERSGSFRLLPGGDVSFTVGNYDPRQKLVIDPVLVFATYLSQYSQEAVAIAVDSNGNSYVTGYANSGFPVTPGAFPGCQTCVLNQNLTFTFISKLSADGSSLIYSTVLGGNMTSQPTAIAVDSSGDANVSGDTWATDFPTKSGQPVQTGLGTQSGFLVSLSPDGSSLNYGTLLGSTPGSGNLQDSGTSAVTLDSNGNAYVTGDAGSGFFTTSGAYNGTQNGLGGAYIAKFSPQGILLYGAMLGSNDQGYPASATAVAVDASGAAYIAGTTGSGLPTTNNAYLQQFPPVPATFAPAVPFVAKISPDAKNLVYATYLDYAQAVFGIGVLPNGNVFVAGNDAGSTYPTTPNAYETNSGSGRDSFLTELNSTGSALVYSTMVTNALAIVYEFTIDSSGNLWLAGQGLKNVPSVSVVAEFDPTGEFLQFLTDPSSGAGGFVSGIAVDANHQAHLAGAAEYGMLTTPGVYDPAIPTAYAEGFGSDATWAFVSLLDANQFTVAVQTGTSGSSTVAAGQTATYELTVTPTQGYSGTVSYTCGNLPANASCSFNPPNLSLSGGTPESFSVTIATEAPVALLRRKLPLGSVLACFLILLPFGKNRRRSMTFIAAALLLAAAIFGISACGGGGGSGSGSSGTPAQEAASGTYTIHVSVADGTSTRVQDITLVVQ